MIRVLHDPLCHHHVASTNHPECPERLDAILRALVNSNRSIKFESGPDADLSWIESVHTQDHIARVKQAVENAPSYLDPDTYVHRESWKAALRACGLVMKAVDMVMNGECDKAFCAIRPPGHHAESNRPMGFCLFNNIAVAARYAQKKYALKKIFILDWDVHHGNGTQEIFYHDASVFYMSFHQYPLYPGTGSAAETGMGPGLGFTYNIPLAAGGGDEIYFDAMNIFSDSVRQFKPDLIMLSAGFDAHQKDPLAGMNVSTEGFLHMTKILCNSAQAYTQGKVVSILEGGYDLQALGESVVAHVQEMSR